MFACRVCGFRGADPAFCPTCLAPTMLPSADADDDLPGAAATAPEPDPVEIPIDGTLDLHTVRPAEVKALVTAYLEACVERGIAEVRIVHGKGTGALRRTVHALLPRLPMVRAFRTADEAAGGWGATLAELELPARPPR